MMDRMAKTKAARRIGPARGALAAHAALAIGTALTLASCARHVPPAAVAVAPEPAPPRPALPVYLGAVVPPPLGPDGQYRTINSGIGAQQAMWHVRAALNVAAIGCRGVADAALTANYNAVLKAQKAALAKANAAVEADFRARYGAGWQAAHDQYMTRLYNFFAQPTAKAAFCTAADPIAAEAAATPASGFATLAAAALPKLEEPFLAVYREVDATRAAQLAWDGRYGPNADRTLLAATPPAAAPALTATSPRLAYADMDTLLAWQPRTGTAIAFR